MPGGNFIEHPVRTVGREISVLTRLRALVLVLAICALSADLAIAQNRPLPKIGELWGEDEAEAAPYRQKYVDSMRALGWIDGKTVQYLVRYDRGDRNRFPALAAELVSLGVNVLVVINRALPAARKATNTIPIVCLDFWDPVAEGVTSNLRRPGGNITGVSWQSFATAAKRVELALELMPGLQRVGALVDTGDPGSVIEAKGVQAAADRARVKMRLFEARDAKELPNALAAIRAYRPEILIVSTTPLTILHRDEIVRFASNNRVPTITEASELAEAGFLVTYGADTTEIYRLGANQVDRILRGVKPGDLPIQQSTKFELVINAKTAKALAVSIPESIMLRATKVIR